MGQLVFGPYENSVFDEYYYDDDYTFRVWIPPALLTECSKFRIGFGYYSTQSVYIDQVFVGQSSGATADSSFDGTPTAVLFSGVAAVTYNSAVKYSDYVEYDIDPTKGLIISMEFGASHSYMPYVEVATGDEADITTYRDYGDYGDSASFVADATYATRRHLVVSIDNVIELDDDLSNLKSDANINHAHQSNAISATADIGAGDNGVVTTTVDTAGTDGNNFTIEVVEGVGVDVAMSAALVGQDITVTLGTDGAGVLDPVKNTAILIAAAVDALDDVNSLHSGTGATAIGAAEGPTSFTGGVDQWRLYSPLSNLCMPSEWDTLGFDAQTGSFTVGNTVTGATSGATATIAFVVQSGGVGTLYLKDVVGTFQNDEIIYESALGSELLTNGDMELDSHWSDQGTPTTNERSDVQSHGGTYSRHIVGDSVADGIYSYQAGILTVGTFVKYSLWVYPTTGTRYDGYLSGASNVSFDEILTLNEWNNIAVYGLVDSVNAVPYIYGYNSANEFYVDDISVKQITNAALANGILKGAVSYQYLIDTLPDLQLSAFGKIGTNTLDDGILPDLQCTGRTGYNAELGRHEAVYLPDLRCEAQAGERANLEENLPDLRCVGYFGAQADNTLPDLQISATGTAGQVASLDEKLPVLECVGYTGARCGTLRLPDLQVEATASGSYASLDAKLPTLMIEAEGSTPTTGVLDMDLTFPSFEGEMSLDCRGVLESDLPNLKLSATAHGPRTLNLDATLSDLRLLAELRREVIGELDDNLPGLRIEATAHCDLDTISLDENLPILTLLASGYSGEIGTLSATLPDLRIEASILSEEIGTLSATLPTLVMGDTRTGGTGGESGVMSYSSRFADYILRYLR